MWERLVGKQIESCALGALQARSEEYLRHSCRWLLFEQRLFVTKECDLVGEDVFSVASQHFTSLFEMKWGTFIRPTEQMCHLTCLEKCQLLPVRIPSLFEQNVLKAVGRMHKREAARCMRERLLGKQIEICALGALFEARSEEHLKAFLQMTPIRGKLLFFPKHVTLSEKMRLAWLVSIPASCFFDQQALHDKKLKGDICGFPNWDWKIWKQSLSISEHCKKTTHHTKWPSPIFLNLSRASCMCGRVDINWVTVMPAGGRHVNSDLFQWDPACLTKFLCWYIP